MGDMRAGLLVTWALCPTSDQSARTLAQDGLLFLVAAPLPRTPSSRAPSHDHSNVRGVLQDPPGDGWLHPAWFRRVTALLRQSRRHRLGRQSGSTRRLGVGTAWKTCQARLAAFAFARLAVMAGIDLFAQAGLSRLCSDALRSCCRRASLVADRSLLMVSSVLSG